MYKRQDRYSLYLKSLFKKIDKRGATLVVFQPTTSFIDGLTSQNQSSEEILKQGVREGTNTAMDRLADYMIDRAEQYQPVISIPANIDVELVFIEGVALDGSNILEQQDTKKKVKKLSFNEVTNE